LLWLISFQAAAEATTTGPDTDQVRIYQGPGGTSPGAFIDAIPLDAGDGDEEPSPWAEDQSLGPRARLTGDTGPDTGSVRRYNVTNNKKFTFDVFVPAAASGGPLGQGWFLTFGKTNPSTLNYEP
jgi:hypothetical protein